MNVSIYQRLEAIERQLNKLNIRGVIELIDPDMGVGGCVRVKYGDKQLTDWLPIKPLRSGKAAIWWFPEIGEGVTITDLETGEVLPGSFTTNNPPPNRDPDVFYVNFGDGSSIQHNRKEHTLKVINVGDMDFSTDKKIKMNAGEGFEFTGDIEHTGAQHSSGDIKSDKDISDEKSSMQDMRDKYNAHNHSKKMPPPSANKMS